MAHRRASSQHVIDSTFVVSRWPDDETFHASADALEAGLGAEWTLKMDADDERCWQAVIDNRIVRLHMDPVGGIRLLGLPLAPDRSWLSRVWAACSRRLRITGQAAGRREALQW
jgi:hypothetical protein